MRSVVRSVAAVVLGSLLAGILIAGLESAGHLIYPPPPGLDPSDLEAMRAALANLPAGALLLVLLAWGAGAGAGAWLAARLAPKAPMSHAMIVGLIFLAAAVMELLLIPHPAWFWIPVVAIFFPAAYAGARLAAPR